MRRVQVLADGGAGHRLPPVGARQLDDPVHQLGDGEPVAHVVVDLRDGQRLLARTVRDGDDVQRREDGREPRDPLRELRRHPGLDELVADGLPPDLVGAAQQLGQLGPDAPHAVLEELDGLGELHRLRPVVEQPPGAALDEAARVQPDAGLDVGGHLAVEGLDRVPDGVQPEDLAGRGLRPHDLLQRGPGLLPQPVQEGRAAAVDGVVDQHRRDDLAAQRVLVDPLAERVPQLLREVGVQQPLEVLVVGQPGGQQLPGRGDLDVGEQDRQFRLGQTAAGADPLADLPVGGQELQRAVEVPVAHQAADDPLVGVEQAGRLGHRVGQRHVLRVVVAQHQRADLVGHLREGLVALLDREVALRHGRVEQDLDVHLVVRGVHAGAVVDRVRVDLTAGGLRATAQRVLDAAELGQAQVAALADDVHPQVRAVHPDRVVGLVADVRVRLGGRLDVRADAAVPEQVDLRLEDRLHQLGGGHLGDARRDAEGLPHLRVDRDRLGRAGVDAAALGEQLGVVVGPGRARQLEEAAALGVRGGRVRVRVEEDVPVVEGGHQADVLGEQHAVAEHVAGHVADADDGEVLALRVVAQLPEVPLDGLPGAAGGDAHALVVVARRAAGGEGVAEPEAVRLGDLVGDVGERRGALVGGDDEVRVVLVVADDALGVHDLAADQVVGDVEQAGDERLVAGDALGQPRVAVHRRVGQPLADEAALRADRHDDGVLHHLRLDQAEHLGTEVLAPVRPAQPAARDLAEAQVHALDAGRVHPDLVRGPGRGQVRDGLRVELDGQVAVRLAVLAQLEVVGAQGGLDDREERAQDAVLVQRDDLVERAVQLLQQTVDQLVPGALPLGGHPGLEEVHQQPRGVHVGAERVLHVRLGERGAGLPQVLRVRAQHHGLPPVETGPQHQVVEVVVLRPAGPHRREGVLEPLARVVARHVLGHPQPEVVDPRRGPVRAAQLVRALVDDLDAEPLEHGQHRGERDRLTRAVDLEAALACGRAHRLVQAEREVAVAAGRGELLQVLEVGDRGARRVVGLVALGERLAVAAQQLRGALLADLRGQRLGEAVGPGPGGLHQAGLDAVDVGVGELLEGGARLDADDEVQPGEDRLGVPRGVVDAGAAELFLEDVDQPQPHAGGVAVAGQVDEGGVVAPVLVLAQEQPQPAALLEVEDGGRDGAQLVGRGLEQLVARVGLQDLEQVAAVVAVRGEARVREDLGDLAAHDGDPAYGLGVRGRGEQAQEAALARDIALGVELLHPDVVEVGGAVHGGAAVGLGQHEQLVLTGLGPGVGGQPAEGRRRRAGEVGVGAGVVALALVRGVGAQDAEAGAGHGGEHVLLVAVGLGRHQLVLAVAEEGEVVGGEPAQQLLGLGHVLLVDVVGRLGGQPVGEALRGLPHLLPVLDGLADVGQDAQQVGGDLLEVAAVGLAVDLDVDPGLGQRVVRKLRVRARAVVLAVVADDLQQLAGDIAADDHLRVDHDMDAATLAGELIGDGVHKERHVVGDDLDDGVAARPAVLLDRRGVHPDIRGSLRPGFSQPVVGKCSTEDIDRVAAAEVFGSGVQVVTLEVRGKGLRVETLDRMWTPGRGDLGDPGGPCEQLGLGFIQLGLHVLWLLSRAVA